MVDLLFFFLIVLAAGLLWNEGCWSNGITLINVILAGLMAFNFYEPLAGYLETIDGSFTYFWDFIAQWAIFAATLGILRALTDTLSKIRVRFIPPVEQAGRVILGLWAGWVFVCFTAATLHTAPLAANSFRESFDRKPDEGLFFGFAPDRLWLSLVQTRSQGALGWWDEAPASKEYGTEDQDGNTRVFDPKSEYIVKYRTRRKNLEAHYNETGALRVQK